MGDKSYVQAKELSLDGTDKAKKERSPSFPFISLSRAIDRLTSFEKNHKRNATRVAVVAQTWGYRPKSSGLQQTIAALKAYGLLEIGGDSQERKVQLTELASRLLGDSRPGIRDQAIRESALNPKLFREYVEHWGEDRPSDAHRISELELDGGFTAEAARTFIRVFDETVSFAGVDSTGKHNTGHLDKPIKNNEIGDDTQIGSRKECGPEF